MLTSSLQLSGTQVQYISALNAPGNLRSTTMHRSQSQGPVAAINMLAADCKVMRLHEKPPAETRSKPMLNSAASLLSVYAARPVPMTRASTDTFTSVKVKRRSNSPQKTLLRKRSSGSPVRGMENSPVRRSLPANSETVNALEKKATKVYLSQKQSSSLKDCGALVPCAPPATPTPEHLKLYDYVPSLSDIKSQRHMRQRLEGMSKSDQKKLEKRREEQMKQEKLSYKEKIAEQKKRQRQEIYALNKVMTDLEYKNFEQLVKTKGLNISS